MFGTGELSKYLRLFRPFSAWIIGQFLMILEGILKLQENRECADCRSKAPRWASINLGIFVCMQCSGIHRGLGVHISQVRSITLDTWLPEQVTFMQSIGNSKSNEYWEAELPTNYDRGEIERFIHAKYIDKRWASKKVSKPIPIPSQRSKNDVPRKQKRLSLDEQSFHIHTEKIAPPDVKIRTGSLDMSDLLISFPCDSCLSHNHYSNMGNPYVPPSDWTTFEYCKEQRSRLTSVACLENTLVRR